MFKFIKPVTLVKDVVIVIIIGLLIFSISVINNSFGSFLGEATSSVKAESVRMKNNELTLKETLEDNKKANQIRLDNLSSNKDSVSKIFTYKLTSTEDLTKLQTTKDKKIKIIRESSPANTDISKLEAKVQIDILWENFCHLEPKSCKGV